VVARAKDTGVKVAKAEGIKDIRGKLPIRRNGSR
jgi:hypothetical protein